LINETKGCADNTMFHGSFSAVGHPISGGPQVPRILKHEFPWPHFKVTNCLWVTQRTVWSILPVTLSIRNQGFCYYFTLRTIM